MCVQSMREELLMARQRDSAILKDETRRQGRIHIRHHKLLIMLIVIIRQLHSREFTTLLLFCEFVVPQNIKIMWEIHAL